MKSLTLSQQGLVHARSGLNLIIEERDAFKVSSLPVRDLLDRLRRTPTEGDVTIDLERGDVYLIERACRVLMARCQQMIKPETLPEQKALYRESATEAGKTLTIVRQARGLPW